MRTPIANGPDRTFVGAALDPHRRVWQSTRKHVPLEDFAWVNGINAWGVVLGSKHFLPHMPSGDAHLVNVISAAGIYAEPGRSACSFTKFGVRAFTEALRLELAEREVGVTAVYPGIIDTNIAAATRHATSSSGPQETPPV